MKNILLVVLFVSPLFAELKIWEVGVADYLERKCSQTNMEHIVLYDVENARLLDLTDTNDATSYSVFVDFLQIVRIVKSSSGRWVMAHCHVVDYEYGEKRLKDDKILLAAFNKLMSTNRNLVRTYFLQEFPSGFESAFQGLRGDFLMAAMLEMAVYQQNKQAELLHRVIVVEKNNPTKIVSYGFTPRTIMFLRTEAEAVKNLNGVVAGFNFEPNLIHIKLALIYNRIKSDYIQSRCKLSELVKDKRCKPIRTEELIDLINRSEEFFVKVVEAYSKPE